MAASVAVELIVTVLAVRGRTKRVRNAAARGEDARGVPGPASAGSSCGADTS
ncbi:hypothetical protein [Streptomyces sp. NPDC051219]|uniref:hypothetical protein n=1 Tax=Streptomyces sp. NPDC051219 TaxID=3155283 RepID=UPI003433512D